MSAFVHSLNNDNFSDLNDTLNLLTQIYVTFILNNRSEEKEIYDVQSLSSACDRVINNQSIPEDIRCFSNIVKNEINYSAPTNFENEYVATRLAELEQLVETSTDPFQVSTALWQIIKLIETCSSFDFKSKGLLALFLSKASSSQGIILSTSLFGTIEVLAKGYDNSSADKKLYDIYMSQAAPSTQSKNEFAVIRANAIDGISELLTQQKIDSKNYSSVLDVFCEAFGHWHVLVRCNALAGLESFCKIYNIDEGIGRTCLLKILDACNDSHNLVRLMAVFRLSRLCDTSKFFDQETQVYTTLIAKVSDPELLIQENAMIGVVKLLNKPYTPLRHRHDFLESCVNLDLSTSPRLHSVVVWSIASVLIQTVLTIDAVLMVIPVLKSSINSSYHNTAENANIGLCKILKAFYLPEQEKLSIYSLLLNILDNPQLANLHTEVINCFCFLGEYQNIYEPWMDDIYKGLMKCEYSVRK